MFHLLKYNISVLFELRLFYNMFMVVQQLLYAMIYFNFQNVDQMPIGYMID